jgi:hypothetical protein
VRAEPEQEYEQTPGEAGPLVAAGSALLEGLPSNVPPAARDRLAAALIPPSGVRRLRLGHRPAQLPRDPASEVLAWMAHALIAATRAGWVTPRQRQPRRTPAARSTSESKTTRWHPACGPPYRFACRSHSYRQPAAPSQARRRGSQQGHAPHRRRRPQRRDRPHQSSAASSNRYINGRSAYSASTGDRAPEPGNNRRSARNRAKNRVTFGDQRPVGASARSRYARPVTGRGRPLPGSINPTLITIMDFGGPSALTCGFAAVGPAFCALAGASGP